jgi:hypothetical protein
MDAFLPLLAKRRRLLFDEAGTRLGLAPASVEKDFWVCWTLRHLFALPATGPHLTFKGGTSLSKCWDLIQRFSEDIDIVIDRDFLGFGGDRSPEAAPSQKQRGKRLDALKAACQEHIQAVLLPDFTAAVNAALQDVDRWTIDMDADDPDHQTINQNVHVESARDDLDALVLDADVLDGILKDAEPEKKAKAVEIKLIAACGGTPAIRNSRRSASVSSGSASGTNRASSTASNSSRRCSNLPGKSWRRKKRSTPSRNRTAPKPP